MALYTYSGRDRQCGHVVGVIEANDIQEAQKALRMTYEDYDSWVDVDLEKVTFDHDGICEIYYG